MGQQASSLSLAVLETFYFEAQIQFSSTPFPEMSVWGPPFSKVLDLRQQMELFLNAWAQTAVSFVVGIWIFCGTAHYELVIN